MKKTNINKYYFLPLIFGLLLFCITSVWVYHETKLFGDRTKKIIEQEGSITVKAIKGIIQSQMFRDKISKRRLEFLLDNIVDQTILKYVSIKKNNKVIFISKSNDLSELNGSNFKKVHDDIFYFTTSINFQKLPPPPPPPPPKPNLFHMPYADSSNLEYYKPDHKMNTARIIDLIKAENNFKKHPENFINFAKSEQTITVGIDISIFKKQLDNELRKTLIFYIISCAAIAIWIFAWIYFLKTNKLKLKYAEIKEKTTRLEELSLAASGLAHEIKNPLGIIRGLTQQIIKDDNSSSINDLAVKVIDEVDVTTERLSDFMNYAKHKKPVMTDIELQDYFNNVSEVLCFELNAKEIELKIKVDNISILTDKEFFNQIIINIIMNSINACSKGNSILIDCYKTKNGYCVLEIYDNGPGIEETLLNNIFKPYVSNNPQGHGIGLAIVKKLIDAMDWEINMESTCGSGTKTTMSNIKLVE